MRWLLLVFLAVVAVACGDAHRTPSKPVKSATPEQLHAVAEKPAKSRTAQCLDSLGYENIAERDTSIAIDLMYARADNFVGRVLYADLREAYLHPVAMECLLKAQRLLREKHPEYRLIVYDAARPMSVQQQMWDVVKARRRAAMCRIPHMEEVCTTMGLPSTSASPTRSDGRCRWARRSTISAARLASPTRRLSWSKEKSQHRSAPTGSCCAA